MLVRVRVLVLVGGLVGVLAWTQINCQCGQAGRSRSRSRWVVTVGAHCGREGAVHVTPNIVLLVGGMYLPNW